MKSTEITSADWRSLYKIDGVATLILLIYSLVTMIIMVVLGPPPETVKEMFAVLQANEFMGLLRLDLLTVICMPLYYLLFLGFYVALMATDHAHAAVAALLGCAGVTLFLATPSVLSLVPLSDGFANATTEVEKLRFLAAAEALLASDMWHGMGAMVGGTLVQIIMTLVSIVMLRSERFGSWTAYVGVVTHGLDLAHILMGFFFAQLEGVLMAVAGPLYLIWFPLLARDFFRLGSTV
jgi:hypothetical protein